MSAPGDRVGPYRLLERAGAGGMGVVYRAEHLESGAIHALKVLLPGAGADEALRLRREAEALGRVDHPNVVRVHSAGEDGGRVWIALEWVAGGALTGRLTGGALTPLVAAALVRSLARGVAHAHARGVLHRDIKPANVLLTAEGTPKLTDFGLARLRGAVPLTQTGDVVGTPLYMAPEQAQGSKAVDERTDVYGLGALLYHLLTGRPPFAGTNAMSILIQVATAAPARPRSLEPRVPGWLEEVCLRALAKEPDARHPSAAALADALAGPTPSRRGAAPLIARGLVLVTVVVAVGVVATRDPRTPTTPTTPTTRPSGQVDVAAVLSDLLARAGAAGAAEALGASLARGDEAAAEAVRTWTLELAVSQPLVAEQVAQALGSSPAGLLLAAEVSLALGRGPEALERAQWADDAASSDRSRRALVLALLLAGRVDDANRARPARDGLTSRLLDAERLRAALEALTARFRGEQEVVTVFGGSQDLCEELAGLLLQVERRRADQAYAALGPMGRGLSRRFLQALLALDGELSLLQEPRAPISVEKVDEILSLIAGAVPDLPEANALRVVSLWGRANVATDLEDQAGAAEMRGAVLAGLDEALGRPLPDRQRRVAGMLRFRLLRIQDTNLTDPVELARAEALIGAARAAGGADAALVGRHADRVAAAYLDLAWQQPAERERHVQHVLALCDAIPSAPSVFRPVARLRILAAFITGRAPSSVDIDFLEPDERALVNGVVALANGDARGAIRGLEEPHVMRSKVRRDALGIIALARAVLGDLPAAREAAERSRKQVGVDHWLYWCNAERVLAGIDMIERKTWSPSPAQVFPPR